MKFKDYEYKRPEFEDIKLSFDEVNCVLKSDASFDELLKAIHTFDKKRIVIDTMGTLASIRNSINTQDEFYEKEEEYWDELGPKIQELFNEYNKNLLASPHLDKLKKEFGELLFKQIELEMRTFDPKIVPLLIEEGKKTTEYQKLMASIEIEYKGEKLNIPQAGKYLESSDRLERKTVNDLIWNATEKVIDKIDQIYDDLVHIRDKMAKELGFKNYVELGYMRLGRVDYNAEDVKKYREEVLHDIVPLAEKIVKKQSKRIGIDDLYNYDLNVFYKDGNCVPLGTTQEKLEKTLKMYQEMNPEIGKFAKYMVDHELVDLDSKKGKAGGGYCTFIPLYKSPFVFANFNVTIGDVGTLTHEFGHAFQVYCTRDFEVQEYHWPTLEACEIHSMSMEFFTWPYMEKFFGKDADKYRFSHLADAIEFLPYGITIDEFQHWVYEHPNATHDQRCAKYLEIEKANLPHKKYDYCPTLAKGRWWLRQGHVFGSPFYYIDYTLAQVVAFQFLLMDQKNHQNAWKRYLKLTKCGGKYPFCELLEKNHMKNPFEDGTVKKIVSGCEKILKGIDTSNF